ncbi:3-oxoacyl-ACP reductase FabG [Nocardioides panzhihuensis]|uniref:3-oxoacyl-[acyl-carrier protein] reductase n=1 Tax=Nocardioides panzhihuensis TaxID=860243 RepID=A0A7Z0IUN8_9ACTN|nr:3-oxoacyl-ACP reductase FabG [Nocardioides panzhihuensis]NYI80404.1 3-oxoacyl-[acyl-carrier protein] reductase [Nocardioides panzhihuensis]
MNDFAGRSALITGAARGLGLETAKRLAEKGARVAVLDLDERAAATAAQQLPGEGHVGVGVDVAQASSVTAAVDRVLDAFGDLHIAVNNAGITRDNLLHKMSEDDWDAVLDVHLKGTFLITRAVQATMVAQRYGRIVNTSSVIALGNRGQANYAAAKAGIQAFTRTVAIELGGFGVTSNAVAPGFIDTEMTAAVARRLGMSEEQFNESLAKQNVVGRMGQPADIAHAVLFLASEAASFVTGQTIYVDGGWTLV